jgi:hypothetical protein
MATAAQYNEPTSKSTVPGINVDPAGVELPELDLGVLAAKRL